MVRDGEADHDGHEMVGEMSGGETVFTCDGRCPICLNEFTEQRIGIPSSCQHAFCMDCILEWSKISCLCPVDRIKFCHILLYDKLSGLFQRSVSVTTLKAVDEEYLGSVFCQICESPNNEETLLLCDGCDLGYHCECLRPPLHDVPLNELFCIACRERLNLTFSPLSAPRRALGRTRTMERVRVEIDERRSRGSCRRDSHGSCRQDVESQIDEIVSNIMGHPESWFHKIADQRSNTPAKKSPRSSCRTRRTSMKQNKKCDWPGTRKKNSACTADLLICQSLSLFGENDNLDVFLSRNTEEESSALLVQKHRQLSAAAVRFNLPLPSLLASGAGVEVTERSSPERIPDLMELIIQQQEILNLPSSSIHIQRNGSLAKHNHSNITASSSNKHGVCVGRNKISTGPKNLTVPVTAPSGNSASTTGSSPRHKKCSGGKAGSKTASRRGHSSAADCHGAVMKCRADRSQTMHGKQEETIVESLDLSVFKDKKNRKTSPDPAHEEKGFRTARKIKIKRVTVLPLKQSSNAKDKQQTEAYDPFNPTDEGVMGLSREIETTESYDPFQPTASDEENDGGSAVLLSSKAKSGNGVNAGKVSVSGTENVSVIDSSAADCRFNKHNAVVLTGNDLRSSKTILVQSEEIDMFADPVEKEVKKESHVGLLLGGQAQVGKRTKFEASVGIAVPLPENLRDIKVEYTSFSQELTSMRLCQRKQSKSRDSSIASSESESDYSNCPIHEASCSENPVKTAQREHSMKYSKAQKNPDVDEDKSGIDLYWGSMAKGGKRGRRSDTVKEVSRPRKNSGHHCRTTCDGEVSGRSKMECRIVNQSGSPQRRLRDSEESRGKRGKERSRHHRSSCGRHKSRSRSMSPPKERRQKYKSYRSKYYKSKTSSQFRSVKECSLDRSPGIKSDEVTYDVVYSSRKRKVCSGRSSHKKDPSRDRSSESQSKKTRVSKKNRVLIKDVAHVTTPETGEYVSPEARRQHSELKTRNKKSKRRKEGRHSNVDAYEILHHGKKKLYRLSHDHHYGLEHEGGSKRRRHGKKFKEKKLLCELTRHNTSEGENLGKGKKFKAKKRKHEIVEDEGNKESSAKHRHSSPLLSQSKPRRKRRKKVEESEPGTICNFEINSRGEKPMLPDQKTIPFGDEKKLHAEFPTELCCIDESKAKWRTVDQRCSDTMKKDADDLGFGMISPNKVCLVSKVESERTLSPSNARSGISTSPKYALSEENGVDHLLEKSLDNKQAIHSPSTPSMSPNSDQNVSFSQEIKETLSCAEEFVEQSRRRWKHRMKPSGDLLTTNPCSYTCVVVGKENPSDAPHKAESLKLDIFAESPSSRSGIATSFNVLSAHAGFLTSSNTPKVFSIARTSKVVSVLSPTTSCTLGVETSNDALDETYSADTDHRTSAILEKMHETADRANIGTPSMSEKLENSVLPAVLHKHKDGLMSHPIKTVSGIPHSDNPEIHDGTGLFDEDRVFEAFASRFSQNTPSSTLIEVPMSEARIPTNATTTAAAQYSMETLAGHSVGIVESSRKPAFESKLSLSSNPGLKRPAKDSEHPSKFIQVEDASPGNVKVSQAKLQTESKDSDAVLNPTQILNSIGLNPQQKSAAQNAILSIAELSKHLKLDKIVKTASQAGKKALVPNSSPDNIESSAVEMYNKGKQQGFVQKIKFQERVAEEAKIAIKPYYERREISKAEYKEIMKRAVNKICSSESSMEVNSVKTRRLIRRYIEKYQQKNAFKKDRMRSKLSNEVRKKGSESPLPPKYQPLSPPTQAFELSMKLEEQKFPVGTPNLLKRERRKIVTLPDLPLPPPPPPPPLAPASKH